MIKVTYLDRKNKQRFHICPMSAHDAGPIREKDLRRMVRKAYGSGPLKLEGIEVVPIRP